MIENILWIFGFTNVAFIVVGLGAWLHMSSRVKSLHDEFARKEEIVAWFDKIEATIKQAEEDDRYTHGVIMEKIDGMIADAKAAEGCRCGRADCDGKECKCGPDCACGKAGAK